MMDADPGDDPEYVIARLALQMIDGHAGAGDSLLELSAHTCGSRAIATPSILAAIHTCMVDPQNANKRQAIDIIGNLVRFDHVQQLLEGPWDVMDVIATCLSSDYDVWGNCLDICIALAEKKQCGLLLPYMPFLKSVIGSAITSPSEHVIASACLLVHHLVDVGGSDERIVPAMCQDQWLRGFIMQVFNDSSTMFALQTECVGATGEPVLSRVLLLIEAIVQIETPYPAIEDSAQCTETTEIYTHLLRWICVDHGSPMLAATDECTVMRTLGRAITNTATSTQLLHNDAAFDFLTDMALLSRCFEIGEDAILLRDAYSADTAMRVALFSLQLQHANGMLTQQMDFLETNALHSHSKSTNASRMHAYACDEEADAWCMAGSRAWPFRAVCMFDLIHEDVTMEWVEAECASVCVGSRMKFWSAVIACGERVVVHLQGREHTGEAVKTIHSAVKRIKSCVHS